MQGRDNAGPRPAADEHDAGGQQPGDTREAGKSAWWLTAELRRLAFVKLTHRLGLPLKIAAAVLDASGPSWRQTVREQIGELEAVIDQAKDAQRFLTHALNCPTEHPARECPTMIGCS